MSSGRALLDLPWAHGEPALSGSLRQHVDDFQVEEILGFEPEGGGEHVYLWIEKAALNTDQVAGQLARHAGVGRHAVSYAGMKDRRALTRQWFSVHLPGESAGDWQALASERLSVLAVTRHRKKLRRGVHRGNRFALRLRSPTGDGAAWQQRAARIARAGVPNYFGEQRFGHDGNNLTQAQRWFRGEMAPGRHQRGLYLSAVRAHLFNTVLAERVMQGRWGEALPGDLLMLDGSRSVFAARDDDADIGRRLDSGDVHPTGPLPGRPGKLEPGGAAAALEADVLARFPQLLEGLESRNLQAERRSLRVIPTDLAVEWRDGAGEPVVELRFTLPRGCFATAVVRELCRYSVSGDNDNNGSRM